MNKKNLRYILVLIVILILIVFLFFIFRVRETIEKFTINNESVYFYVDDVINEYDGKIVLDRNKSVTEFTIDNKEWKDLSSPIYFKSSQKVLFPSSMSIVSPLNNVKQLKVNYYSEIYNVNGKDYIRNINISKEIDNVFFFDGVNTYFFIDDVEFVVGQEIVDLGAYSFINANYKGFTFVYNYKTKEMKRYDTSKENIIVHSNGYSVNLSIDTLTVGDKNAILIKDITKLANYK